MVELARIVVLVDPAWASPNETKGMHWAELARRRRTMGDLAVMGWRCAGEPRASGPVVVTLTARRARAMDLDNLIAGCKGLLDGLFAKRGAVCIEAGEQAKRMVRGLVTPDDGPEWVTELRARQEIAARWRGLEEVEVRIEEVEACG